MAMTKVEAAKLTQDMMLRGVIETIITDSMILELLPFMEVTGTAVTYNREATLPAATFYDVGDAWTEATPTFTQKTATLKILGGDADVDNFIQATYADPNDVEAEVIANRAKSVAYKFNEGFIIGDSVADPKSFDGLRTAVPAGQVVDIGANGGPLTLDLMDEVIDKVKPGRPDALLMSKRSRRKLSALRRASGNLLETDRTDFGRRALLRRHPDRGRREPAGHRGAWRQRRGDLQHLPDPVRPGCWRHGSRARRHRHRRDRRVRDQRRDQVAHQVVLERVCKLMSASMT
jgi:HK97 family phage major capsid protein